MLAQVRLLLPILVLLTLFTCMWGGNPEPPQHDPVTTESNNELDPPQVVLAELFTSQGCSSCPPADQVLQALAEDAKAGEVSVIVLSYHVDYWNRLGWRDPYSQAKFSERQRDYARHINDRGVYTPQLVINGQSGHIGSREREVRIAIQAASKQNHAVNVLKNITWRVDEKVVQVDYELSKVPAHAILQIALVQKYIENDVNRGENRGKHLAHTNVVRQLISIDEPIEKGQQEIAIPAELQQLQDQLEIYVFVQDAGTLAVLGCN